MSEKDEGNGTFSMPQSNKQVKKTPVLTAFAHGKCARCRKGDMFKGPFTSNTKHQCESCGLTFERHPGYFYTAMYVSYAMSVAEIATLWVATYVLSGGSNDPWLYLFVIIPGLLICAPFNSRYSKVIQSYWLDPGLKYRPELANTSKTEETAGEKA